MRRARVNDVYNEWKTENKGFFHFLYYYFTHADPQITCPFITSEQDALLLDIKYHAGYSGRKLVSCFVNEFLNEIEEMQDAYFVRFAEVFWKLNSQNLLREWQIWESEYNLMHNYDLTEEARDNHSGMNLYNGSSHAETVNTGDDTTRMNVQQTTQTGKDGSSKVTHKVNGFNSSSDGVNSDTTYTEDKIEITADGEDNFNKTEYNSGNTSDGSQSSYSTDTDVNTHSLTRYGNIGITSSVDLLKQQADFWDKWRFFENYLFPCVDRLLTIPLY